MKQVNPQYCDLGRAPRSIAADQLLTTNEAAELLTVAPATLRWWRHARRGPKVTTVGKAIRYRLSDLDEWINSGGAA